MNRPNWIKWLWFGLFLIIFIPLLFWGIKEIKSHKKHDALKKQKAKIESAEITWVWVVTRTQTISIDGEYSAVYYLSKGEGLSLRNSTQPYCVINENGHSVCGEKGEDVTPKLPREDDNMKLKFRTSNGKSGEITLVYWEKRISRK